MNGCKLRDGRPQASEEASNSWAMQRGADGDPQAAPYGRVTGGCNSVNRIDNSGTGVNDESSPNHAVVSCVDCQ